MDNATTLLYIFTYGQDILLSPWQKKRKRSEIEPLFSVPIFSEERKMRCAFPPRFLVCICLFALAGTGCFYREPVRHLSSDICLITPNLTQKEVLATLGPPDQKQKGEQGEIWLYREVKKNLLRKTPYVGEKLGAETYDVVTITFAGDTVATCLYRSYNEEEFKKSGITISGPSAD